MARQTRFTGAGEIRPSSEGDIINLMSAADIGRTIARIAHEIVERNKGAQEISLVGIINRGQYLAQRLATKLEELEGIAPPMGKLDCASFRDDVDTSTRLNVDPDAKLADLVHERRVILVDDVLNTGRTARAALEAIVQIARPAEVQLAVLVDRGRRELPIKADFVGKNIPSAEWQHVSVLLSEADGVDCATIEAVERA